MTIIQVDKYHSKQKASKIIDSLPISTPENISIENICHLNGLTIKTSSHLQASGQLIRIGHRGIISYSSSIINEGRRRFTIAHEFGHFHLHKGVNDSFNCSEKDMLTWSFNNVEIETSANIFAAELLMPEKFAKTIVNRSEVSLNSIETLARAFQTSFVSSAIRFVELVEIGCMLVMSYQGKVEWTKKNRAFKWSIPLKRNLPQLTCAYDCFTKDKKYNKPEHVRLSVWVADIDSSYELFEHSRKITEDRVLSLLYVDEVEEDEIQGLYELPY